METLRNLLSGEGVSAQAEEEGNGDVEGNDDGETGVVDCEDDGGLAHGLSAQTSTLPELLVV